MASTSPIVSCSTSCGSKRSQLENKSAFMVALPGEIMDLILNKLDPAGFHCFGAVCRSWRSIAIAAKKRLQPQLPWLMLSSPGGHLPKFFSLSHGKISKPKLLEACGISCCGSSWGWLIMGGQRGRLFLLNPFTKIQIKLPTRKFVLRELNALFTFPRPYFIRKAVLLSPPTAAIATSTRRSNLDDNNAVGQTVADDCLVIVIDCNRHLFFCRLAEKAWNKMLEGRFEDVIFYNGVVYAISISVELVRMNLGHHPSFMNCNIAPPESERRATSGSGVKKAVYLVECKGELLMVIRGWDFVCSEPDPYGFCKCKSHYSHLRRTNVLKVFKLDSKGQCWTPVENLVDQIIFLGSSGGISLSALDYPSFKGNCIYFTHQNFHPSTCTAYNDTGMFNLEDKSFKPLCLDEDSVSPLFPPVWFTPISC